MRIWQNIKIQIKCRGDFNRPQTKMGKIKDETIEQKENCHNINSYDNAISRNYNIRTF